MNYFREKYSNVIFIVTSDDKEWCQKYLAKPAQDIIVTAKENSGELDLAILKYCNHSIISVGTFGFWTAYLRLEGDVIQGSSGIRFLNTTWEKSNLPTWQFFPDPCFDTNSKLTKECLKHSQEYGLTVWKDE